MTRRPPVPPARLRCARAAVCPASLSHATNTVSNDFTVMLLLFYAVFRISCAGKSTNHFWHRFFFGGCWKLRESKCTSPFYPYATIPNTVSNDFTVMLLLFYAVFRISCAGKSTNRFLTPIFFGGCWKLRESECASPFLALRDVTIHFQIVKTQYSVNIMPRQTWIIKWSRIYNTHEINDGGICRHVGITFHCSGTLTP